VLDRLIQQAILQVLQPRFDPSFSEHSYGFRPGRSAHDAVKAAQRYVQEGRRWVVDVDLKKFFDRVNHVCRVASTALRALKQRVRETTRRSGGRSMRSVVVELRKYLPGWKEYFRLADTPRVFIDHDKWIRHRLRALQLKQWKHGPKVYAELRKLGVAEDTAVRVAANTRRWWRNSAMFLHVGLHTRYYDRMGVPKLAR
jgi:hypothetical protein